MIRKRATGGTETWARGNRYAIHAAAKGAEKDHRQTLVANPTDPFAQSWPLVESWLMAEPNLAAGELLMRLRRRLPDLYPTGAQLRTLQRRVKAWRAERARKLVFAAASTAQKDWNLTPRREATCSDP